MILFIRVFIVQVVILVIVISIKLEVLEAKEEDKPSFIPFYQKQYQLNDTSTKLVGDHGDGHENLYGVRNFRMVLNGVLYRGGANNPFNKHKKRDVRNPLPEDGLKNLCQEGFHKVFYLYPTNYSSSLNPVKCISERARDPKDQNTMTHLQKSPLGRDGQRFILKEIYESIIDPSGGPVYVHCWNGWHASGLISAMALRQFCNYTVDQSVDYWVKNTDGHNKDKGYESFRLKIKKFEPFPEFKISEEQKKLICTPAT